MAPWKMVVGLSILGTVATRKKRFCLMYMFLSNVFYNDHHLRHQISTVILNQFRTNGNMFFSTYHTMFIQAVEKHNLSALNVSVAHCLCNTSPHTI